MPPNFGRFLSCGVARTPRSATGRVLFLGIDLRDTGSVLQRVIDAQVVSSQPCAAEKLEPQESLSCSAHP